MVKPNHFRFSSAGRVGCVNTTFRKIEANPAPLDTLDAYYKQAYEMMSSDEVRGAFDLSQESEKTKEQYGLRQFQQYGGQAGMRMLLARRLVEAGARFVTLRYGSWDDHTNIKKSYELQMPAFIQNRLTRLGNEQKRGTIYGTAIMGAFALTLAGARIAVERLPDRVRIGILRLDRRQHPRQVHRTG